MVVGFNAQKEKFERSPIIECNFTNAIFFGQTGSGKTTSAILPNIKNRIQQDHGVLIYDFKGNQHLQVKSIAKDLDKLDDVYEIGVPWGSSVNLMKFLNSTNVVNILDDLGSDHRDEYWNNAAKNLLSNIYGCYKYIGLFARKILENPKMILESDFEYLHARYQDFVEKHELSYQNIYKCVATAQDMEKCYSSIECRINEYMMIVNSSEFKHLSLKKRNMFFNILNSLQKHHTALGEYKSMKEEGSTSGKYGVLGVLNSILSEVATKDYLNTDDVDITKLLRQGKIVVINVNNISENIINVINTMVYNDLQFMRYEQDQPVTIFLDEAHKILNYKYLPQVDVCRESRFEYIFSTQDEVLIQNKIGVSRTEELLSNIVKQYSYRTNNNPDTSNLEPFEYMDMGTRRKAYAPAIFIDQDELIKAEHSFQKQNKILKMADVRTNKVCRLIYNPKYLENMQVELEFLDEQKILIDYYGKTIKPNTIPKNVQVDDFDFIFGKKDDDYEKLKKDLGSCLKAVSNLISQTKFYESRLNNHEDNFRRIFSMIDKLQLDMKEVKTKLKIEDSLDLALQNIGQKLDLDRMARLLEEGE